MKKGRRVCRWAVGAAAVALLGLGVSAVVLSVARDQPTLQVVGGNAPVNAGATDALDVTAHNSPNVAVDPTDPTRVVIANRVSKPRFGCGVHISHDGGATFTASRLIVDEDAVVPCFAPDAAFGPDGRLHLAYTSFARLQRHGRVPSAIHVTTSEDAGASFAEPVQAAGPLAFHVRLAAHPADADVLYLAWVQTSGAAGFGFTEAGNPVVVARSDDAGATWGEPVTVSPAKRQRVIAPVPVVGEDGTLHLAYLDVGNDRLDYHGAHEGQGGPAYSGTWQLVLARSEDAGATWQENVADAEVVPTGRFLVLFPPAPALTVDGEAVHVAFHDARDGDADVRVWTSRDGGTSWSPPLRVNDSAAGDGSAQYLPALAAAGGRLDVVYYDRRADPDDVRNEVSLQSSFDGGRSFTPRLVISDEPFDSRIGFGAERDLTDLGDRLGLASAAGGVLAVWTDTRSGDAVTGKQDLARALVAVSARPPSVRVLRWGGIALVGLAVLTGLLPARSRRPRRQPAPAPAPAGDVPLGDLPH